MSRPLRDLCPLAVGGSRAHTGGRRHRNYNKACLGCQNSPSKRRCDRDWKVDAKCTECEKSRMSCEKGKRRRAPASDGVARALPPNTNATSIWVASSVNLRQWSQPPAVYTIVPLGAGILLGVSLAKHHFENVFDEHRFMERATLMASDMSPDDHFSPMLYRVFRLLHESSGQEELGEPLLSEAKQAFAEEFEEPTLATVIATILLSWWLSKSRPRFSRDLLGLDSYQERAALRDVCPNKIERLFRKVLTLAEEYGIRLCVHVSQPEALPIYGPGTQSMGTDLAPSEQFGYLVPPRQNLSLKNPPSTAYPLYQDSPPDPQGPAVIPDALSSATLPPIPGALYS
ncbi:uncharacterized protein EI90DRAFT_3044128 [Cantharellus anzutake]|uniref:uncharacterized protein n=1 Tax=Cantharellus anzutake TaxID=1750568 RepID=UPI001906B31E|nr:uncharacterized protein EI90DRAFT_3044128 [Cantharellus anzutake]KAF8336916.1 hypothetical protein EI90DRAFT_3044128 [Cantharellus anzutake]